MRVAGTSPRSRCRIRAAAAIPALRLLGSSLEDAPALICEATALAASAAPSVAAFFVGILTVSLGLSLLSPLDFFFDSPVPEPDALPLIPVENA